MHADPIIAQIIAEVRPYTMCAPENLAATVRLALEAIERSQKGDFAECGTWMGGASFAMLLAQRYRYGRIVKPVWMFDSFQGLPPPDDRDGPLAVTYTREINSPDYHNNCTALLANVIEAVRRFGFSPEEAIVIPGWFNDSLPEHMGELAERQLALLRVDCDFYEPVKYVLQQLTPLVPEEGVVILDDYFAWDGCARATHDFLSNNDLCWRVRSMDKFKGAWMIKRAFRTRDL